MKTDPKTRVQKLRRANPRRSPDLHPEGRLPPGQYLTDKFPVLTYGRTPEVALERWRFRVFGRVESEVAWDYDAFMSLPQTRLKADFHCVTRWSQLDNVWEGVHVAEVVKRVALCSEARFVTVHSYGNYTTNIPLPDLLEEDVLFAHSRNGEPLTPDHGWPLRLIVPKLYGWKSAKWVNGLEFMAADRPGFWESYGYHDRGDPWTEERFR